MKISIVVPVLNEVETVAASLLPLQPLRSEAVQIVVVDGGSTDGTAQRCVPYADVVLFAQQGRAQQMNAGAALATGEALLFLHADTLLPAEALTLVRSALVKHRWGFFPVRITGRLRALPVVAAMMNARSRLSGIGTGDQAIFVKTHDFKAIGGFPNQRLMEDVELCKRLRRFGTPAIAMEPVVTSGRRWEKCGLANTIVLMWQLRWAYWRGADPDWLAERYYGAAAHRPAKKNDLR